MKKISILVFLVSTAVFSQPAKLKQVREMYYSASASSSAADELNEKLRDQTVDNPVLYGYKGMAKLMICYHSYNPYTKLSYFSRGRNLLEEAIRASPENAELRFLRFSVQTNAPVFLNYRSEIQKDKQALLGYLKDQTNSADADLYERIKEYLLSCRHCTEQEKTSIRNLK